MGKLLWCERNDGFWDMLLWKNKLQKLCVRLHHPGPALISLPVTAHYHVFYFLFMSQYAHCVSV